MIIQEFLEKDGHNSQSADISKSNLKNLASRILLLLPSSTQKEHSFIHYHCDEYTNKICMYTLNHAIICNQNQSSVTHAMFQTLNFAFLHSLPYVLVNILHQFLLSVLHRPFLWSFISMLVHPNNLNKSSKLWSLTNHETTKHTIEIDHHTNTLELLYIFIILKTTTTQVPWLFINPTNQQGLRNNYQQVPISIYAKGIVIPLHIHTRSLWKN